MDKNPALPDPTSFAGVFATLATEHREAADLMARILQSPSERAAVWPMTRAALVSHEQGEMREVYPVLRVRDDASALADHHDLDAHRLDQLISQLDTLPIQNESWLMVFQQLVAAVQQHVAEEETRIFPAAQARLGTERCAELDLKYQDAKAKLVTGHVAPPRDPHGVPVMRVP